MRVSILKRSVVSLFGAFCVVYFCGVDWTFETPTQGYEQLNISNVACSGTGPPQTNFVVKFVKSGEPIQSGAGTSTVQVMGHDYGNWSKDLEPPAGLPYSNKWPLNAATIELHQGGQFKESVVINVFENQMG